MSGARRKRREELLEALDREGRRTGSVGALHGKAIADRIGVHPTDYECLDVLDWTGPITAGELARRVGITSGAVTGAIDRLERRGWVRRRSDPSDRRRVIVEIVDDALDAGRAAAYELFAPLAADMAALNDRFDDDQLAAVVDWLRGANDAIERSIARLRQR